MRHVPRLLDDSTELIRELYDVAINTPIGIHIMGMDNSFKAFCWAFTEARHIHRDTQTFIWHALLEWDMGGKRRNLDGTDVKYLVNDSWVDQTRFDNSAPYHLTFCLARTADEHQIAATSKTLTELYHSLVSHTNWMGAIASRISTLTRILVQSSLPLAKEYLHEHMNRTHKQYAEHISYIFQIYADKSFPEYFFDME